MGYYIRVLGRDVANIPLQTLREAAHPGVIEADDAGGEWEELLLRHASGAEIVVIEKNLVVDGQLGADELEEFVNEVSGCKPASAAEWLRQYLPKVKIIYAFQLLDGTDVEGGWEILHKVHGTIWNSAGGIIQADGEGFTNEDGFTIVWQFSDKASGPWNVGVLTDNGQWAHFEINLGDEEHRKAFQSGKVPAGAKLL